MTLTRRFDSHDAATCLPNKHFKKKESQGRFEPKMLKQ